MPGSGKTTIGKKLAEHLAVDFIDLDAEIEKVEGKAIPEIFREKGEDAFRLVEAKLLREWAASPLSFVMATGGGAPCFHRGIDVINEYGLSVFLDCSLPEILRRVRNNQERPLLRTSGDDELQAKLERMRASRLPCYRNAHIVLENPDVESVLKAIAARLKT